MPATVALDGASRQPPVYEARQNTALGILEGERVRQHDDALAAYRAAGPMAERIAVSITETGRLLLLGMGASQHANRMAEAEYRSAGVDAQAMPLSEALYNPLPRGPRTVVIVSQSGDTAEVASYLARPIAGEVRFGITMQPESTLGRALPCLVGHGEPEVAFAATRSLMITLGLHVALAQALGRDATGAVAALEASEQPGVGEAVEALEGRACVVFTGRGGLQGLADAAALTLMELARMPAFALDGGQFRHGPVEILGPDIGVVLLRDAAPAAGLAERLIEICASGGAVPVLFDASGRERPANTHSLVFPACHGLAAAIAMLPALQALAIGIASHRVADVGRPVRSQKVVRVE